MKYNKINIIDISKENEEDYFLCLEECSEEMKDGLCRKECWYDRMSKKGLRVKLAQN